MGETTAPERASGSFSPQRVTRDSGYLLCSPFPTEPPAPHGKVGKGKRLPLQSPREGHGECDLQRARLPGRHWPHSPLCVLLFPFWHRTASHLRDRTLEVTVQASINRLCPLTAPPLSETRTQMPSEGQRGKESMKQRFQESSQKRLQPNES